MKEHTVKAAYELYADGVLNRYTWRLGGSAGEVTPEQQKFRVYVGTILLTFVMIYAISDNSDSSKSTDRTKSSEPNVVTAAIEPAAVAEEPVRTETRTTSVEL